MKPIIFYHGNCLDGFSGAWAAWKKFGPSARYQALSHEAAVPPAGIEGRNIYYIDFCPPATVFEQVRKHARTITVIDHHITHRSIAQKATYSSFCLTESGCVLSWKYFHPKNRVPALLRTIQDHDLFTLKRTSTLATVTALALVQRDFFVWDRIVRDFEDKKKRRSIEILGSMLLEYKETMVDRILEIAEPVTFHRHRAFVVNAHVFYSEVGTRIYRELSVPLGITWHYKDGRIKVSLRSDGSVDCGALAARYGGGGHIGAAGFWAQFDGTFPWKKRRA